MKKKNGHPSFFYFYSGKKKTFPLFQLNICQWRQPGFHFVFIMAFQVFALIYDSV